MKKLNSLAELNDLVYKKWTQLDDMDSKYLSEAGLAAKEAYRSIIWYVGFHDTLESLLSDEVFKDLASIPNRHPEYYKIIRKVNRLLEASVTVE